MRSLSCRCAAKSLSRCDPLQRYSTKGKTGSARRSCATTAAGVRRRRRIFVAMVPSSASVGSSFDVAFS
eukprot:4435641-Pleurochrysis_carterae.AAC.1